MVKGKDKKKPKAQTMSDRGGKQPRSVLSETQQGKVPRSEDFNPYRMNPVWAFRLVDLGGPWCWSTMDQGAILTVLNRLRSFESMTWGEIENGTGSHRVGASKLGKQAQRRLVEIS